MWKSLPGPSESTAPLAVPGLPELAKRVAKVRPGGVDLAARPDESLYAYADRIRRLQRSYPVICFVPVDTHAYEVGTERLHM